MDKPGKYQRTLATIRFGRDGSVRWDDDAYAPTELELNAIGGALRSVEFPTPVKLAALNDALPVELLNCPKENLFVFHDEEGKIVMLQQRIELQEGKRYVPWTYYSDGLWRRTEPEGALPLWGLPQLKEHSTVFIHEGAKAAKAVVEMLEGKTTKARAARLLNPWVEELSNAAHLGWIGGALSPLRTDWSAINRAGVKRVIIVSDNDAPGVAAVPVIAERIRCLTLHLQFTHDWPEAFDLADPFPTAMFEPIDGQNFYTGPMFRQCLHPATWATDAIPQEDARRRPTYVLRDHFLSQWKWIRDIDVFVCVDFPHIQMKKETFNSAMAALSHTRNLSDMVQARYTERAVKLTYRPDTDKRLITQDDSSAINTYVPGPVVATPGDCGPWHEYLNYLFPDPDDLRTAQRWIATLVGRPDVRMGYAMLLVSEKQGVGKSTLGDVLAELVGRHNCSFPSETMIVESQFTGWLANKRLVVVNEIYSGHSWKAYNKLKSLITDTHVEVNIKHLPAYSIENWTHFFASSNSLTALKLEKGERRWFIPKVTETSWEPGQFVRLRQWLKAGGYGKIMAWAQGFGDYVRPGEHPPQSVPKQEMIEASYTDSELLCRQVAEVMLSAPEPVGTALSWLRDHCRNELGKIWETEAQLGKAVREAGLIQIEQRIKVGGRKIRIVCNKPECQSWDNDRLRDGKFLRPPKDFLGEQF